MLDGKYALVRLLGQGGMGEVYEARHTKIGRLVAVKFLHGEFAKNPEVARRFENEARAAGEVQHENIAGVYDVGALPDGTQYLVMEFLEGEDLDRLLRRERKLPLSRAADLLMQACHGLEVVHRRGIVHRDLKPANLFLTRRASGADLVKVLDFGIAKLRRPEGDASATGTGVALGTPYYMSPEQARGGRDIGTRSDVYALGVIFYELLSGRRPHDGGSLLEILHHILTKPPRPLEEVCPDLPEPVYGLVRKAMALNPAGRFGGVGELAEALAPFVGVGAYRPSQVAPMVATRIETAGGVRIGPDSHPSTSSAAQSVAGVASNTAPAGRRRRRIALAVSAFAIVALGIEAFAWLHGKGGAPPAMPSASAAASAELGLAVASSFPPAPAPSGAASTPPASPLLGQIASGQDGASGRPDDAPLKSEPRRNHGQAGGSLPAKHGAFPPDAGRGPDQEAHASSSGAAPTTSAPTTKPDCTQTYTIDSEGNKHFRPECFSAK